MINNGTVTIHIRLPEEGSPCARPTQAVPLGGDLYKILPTPDYDPQDEVWEFLPGETVRGDFVKGEFLGDPFLAVEKVVATKKWVAKATSPVIRDFVIRHDAAGYCLRVYENGRSIAGILILMPTLAYAMQIASTEFGLAADAWKQVEE